MRKFGYPSESKEINTVIGGKYAMGKHKKRNVETGSDFENLKLKRRILELEKHLTYFQLIKC
jgi:hypothetical protein